MEQFVTIREAKEIFGNSFIGPDELARCNFIDDLTSIPIPEIPYSYSELEIRKNDYILILGANTILNGRPVTIRNLISIFGKNPDVSEPCFYNQDWYEKEDFIDISMKPGWHLIRKNVYEESRAVQPDELKEKFAFPKAVTCTYTFFVMWIVQDEKLWNLDFVWCDDLDHNGDRIYVGKYHDIDGINKNGFSIHRHLALRPCYTCIDCK